MTEALEKARLAHVCANVLSLDSAIEPGTWVALCTGNPADPATVQLWHRNTVESYDPATRTVTFPAMDGDPEDEKIVHVLDKHHFLADATNLPSL